MNTELMFLLVNTILGGMKECKATLLWSTIRGILSRFTQHATVKLLRAFLGCVLSLLHPLGPV